MNKLRLNRIALLMLPILLGGCATGGSSVSACPPLKVYAAEFNKRLATEVESAGPATVEAISDYVVLRRQVAACR